MRTQQEIVDRLSAKGDEFLNFEPEVLFGFLDFEHAKPLLRDGSATEAEWTKLTTGADSMEQAKMYMAEYGWPKALSHRGISAGRTIQKMTAWAWLAEDQKAIDITESTDYAQYGVPILKALCEHWGWPIPDDPAVARMAMGEPCEPGCCNGCGQ